MSKADGQKIVIEFNEQIFTDGVLPIDFQVTVPEYDFVPNGKIVNRIKKVKTVLMEPSIFSKMSTQSNSIGGSPYYGHIQPYVLVIKKYDKPLSLAYVFSSIEVLVGFHLDKEAI